KLGHSNRVTERASIRFNSVGRATPGPQLRVADPEGKVLTEGEVGELHVRSCSLFPGYVRNEAATRASFTADGWFRTGDLARMDGEGNVQLRGRTNELINRVGIKI